MKKHRPESLKPGDMWCHGTDHHPWIFLSGKKYTMMGIQLWELTWFGRKNTNRLEVITDSWSYDSKFEIVSRVNDEI
jgi:hypothetical protein